MASRRGAAGFTLIEVVIAFVLLSVVLVTGFEIFSTGLRRTAELEAHSQALVIAQSRLAAAGVEEPFKEGQLQGETEDRRFRWTMGITPSEEPVIDAASKAPTNLPFLLFRVDVRVSWTAGDGRERHLDLATMAIGPREPPK